jgi:hypothetical protein
VYRKILLEDGVNKSKHVGVFYDTDFLLIHCAFIGLNNKKFPVLFSIYFNYLHRFELLNSCSSTDFAHYFAHAHLFLNLRN